MKKIILTISTILMMLTLCAATDPYYSETVNGISWIYFVVNGYAELGGHILNGAYRSCIYNATESDEIIIPQKLGGYTVRNIGLNAFYNCKYIKSFVIPSTVTNIGSSAFMNCYAMKSITIPSSVQSIGEQSFLNCSGMTDITIPNGVTSIGSRALKGTSLKSIALPDSVTHIGDEAFMSSSLSEIKLSKNLVRIGMSAFKNCSNLKEVHFPEGLRTIDYCAFENCTLIDEIIIPDTVQNVRSDAFIGCSNIRKVTIPISVSTIKYFPDAYSQITNVVLHGEFENISDSMFNGCVNLQGVVIPDSLKNISANAFYNCSCLPQIRIPQSVTNIGEHAFHGCKALVAVEVPNAITHIPDYMFYGCSSLKDVALSESLKSIGENAFYGCSSLLHIDIPNKVAEIGIGAFRDCGIMEVKIPDDVTVINKYSFAGCEKLTSVIMSDNVEKIFPNAFSLCAFERFDFPANLKLISNDAFASCTNLTEVLVRSLSLSSLSDGVFSKCCSLESVHINSPLITSIPNRMFDGCSSLTNIEFSGAITSIGDCAFRDCVSLRSFLFAGTLKTIGVEAFSGCTALIDAILPVALESIGKGAFKGCNGVRKVELPPCTSFKVAFPDSMYVTNVTVLAGAVSVDFSGLQYLVKVVLPDGLNTINYSAFYQCASLETVVIPNSVTAINEMAFDHCSKLEHINIPCGLVTLGAQSFCRCSSIVDVNIPASVIAIERAAFHSCVGLTNVTIASGVTSIGLAAFRSTTNLKTIAIPASVTSIGENAFYESGVEEVRVDIGDANRVKGLLQSSGMDIDAVVFVEPSNRIEYRDTKEVDNPNPTNVWISTGITFEPLSNIGGWRFVGWSPSGVNAGSVGDVVVTANWEWITNDVTFIAGDHGAFDGGKTKDVKVPYGECVEIPELKNDVGYTFAGWLDTNGSVTDDLPGLVITNGATYCAQWQNNSYLVVFNANGGTGNMLCQQFVYDVPQVLQTNAYVRSGYSFKAWRMADEAEMIFADGEVVSNLTSEANGVIALYAEWLRDPIPNVQDDATPEQLAEALDGSADGKLAECITNAATYNAYREWAASVKGTNGEEAAGAQAVKDSPNAWVSFALGSDKLLEDPPKDSDLKVEEFEPTGEAGQFEFTVSVEGVTVGSEAQKENLKRVFGLDGASTLDANDFSSDNVDLEFGTPANGKVKFTAKPVDDKADSFFMRVKVLK